MTTEPYKRSKSIRDHQVFVAAKGLANVRDLPEWLQAEALGRDMVPIAEVVVDALREAHLL